MGCKQSTPSIRHARKLLCALCHRRLSCPPNPSPSFNHTKYYEHLVNVGLNKIHTIQYWIKVNVFINVIQVWNTPQNRLLKWRVESSNSSLRIYTYTHMVYECICINMYLYVYALLHEHVYSLCGSGNTINVSSISSVESVSGIVFVCVLRTPRLVTITTTTTNTTARTWGTTRELRTSASPRLNFYYRTFHFGLLRLLLTWLILYPLLVEHKGILHSLQSS